MELPGNLRLRNKIVMNVRAIEDHQQKKNQERFLEVAVELSLWKRKYLIVSR